MSYPLHAGRFDSRKKAESYANSLRGAGMKNIQIKEAGGHWLIFNHPCQFLIDDEGIYSCEIYNDPVRDMNQKEKIAYYEKLLSGRAGTLLLWGAFAILLAIILLVFKDAPFCMGVECGI